MASRITEMDATDLIGRLVINPNGVEFVVKRLSYESDQACVVIWLQEADDQSESEQGLYKLDGWTVHQKIR